MEGMLLLVELGRWWELKGQESSTVSEMSSYLATLVSGTLFANKNCTIPKPHLPLVNRGCRCYITKTAVCHGLGGKPI